MEQLKIVNNIIAESQLKRIDEYWIRKEWDKLFQVYDESSELFDNPNIPVSRSIIGLAQIEKRLDEKKLSQADALENILFLLAKENSKNVDLICAAAYFLSDERNKDKEYSKEFEDILDRLEWEKHETFWTKIAPRCWQHGLSRLITTLSIKGDRVLDQGKIEEGSKLFEQAFSLILWSKNESQDWNACHCLLEIFKRYLQRHQHIGEYFHRLQQTCLSKHVRPGSLLEILVYSLVGECSQLHLSRASWVRKEALSDVENEEKHFTPHNAAEDGLLSLKICKDLIAQKLQSRKWTKDIREFLEKRSHVVEQLYMQTLIRLGKNECAYKHAVESVKMSQIECSRWYKLALTAFTHGNLTKCILSCESALRKETVISETEAFGKDPEVVKLQTQCQVSLLGVKAAIRAGKSQKAVEFGTAGLKLAAALKAQIEEQTFEEPQHYFPSDFTNPAYLAYGVACTNRAQELTNSSQRLQLSQIALKSLTQAYNQDKPQQNTSLILYNLATVRADLRDVSGAIKTVKASLSFNTCHIPSWHLLALLLSADLKYNQALETVNYAINQLRVQARYVELPEINYEYTLFYLQAAIRWHLQEFTKAIEGLKKLARVLLPKRLIFGKKDIVTHKRKQIEIFLPSTKEISAKQSNKSIPKPVEDAQIEFLIFIMKLYLKVPQLSCETQLLAEMTLKLVEDRTDDKTTKNFIPNIHCILGKCHMIQGSLELALGHLQTAEIHNPNNVSVLCELGSVNYELCDYKESGSQFRRCIQIDNGSHLAWYGLGNVQTQHNELEKAADSYLTSLELEKSSPILPFSTVPRYL